MRPPDPAGTLIGDQPGLLARLGFYDFAGASVVHSTGGWVALALIIVVGPRLGRFNARGQPQTIQGSNLTLSALGVLAAGAAVLGLRAVHALVLDFLGFFERNFFRSDFSTI